MSLSVWCGNSIGTLTVAEALISITQIYLSKADVVSIRLNTVTDEDDKKDHYMPGYGTFVWVVPVFDDSSLSCNM